MQIFSTFENTINLELAIKTLEKHGVQQESIFAVPLDNRQEDRRFFDTISSADGVSVVDIGMALGTAFSVIGASIGFELAWGPIYWGLIGAFVGFMLGLAIRLYIEVVYKKKKRVLKGKHSEVILIIDCPNSMSELVEEILWGHYAMGVAKIK
ncbi:hypothetical protein [Bacillus pinisoli]|uniref:hypothetical protein n=1 Tax=Bacillus pinisoli TaxID=2901866 RepID=UPI001FF689E4|nr:hypothetical protein [Bacillus pinisoli]